MLASDCSVPLCLTPVYRLVSTQHGRDYDVWKQKVAGKQFSVSLYTMRDYRGQTLTQAFHRIQSTSGCSGCQRVANAVMSADAAPHFCENISIRVNCHLFCAQLEATNSLLQVDHRNFLYCQFRTARGKR